MVINVTGSNFQNIAGLIKWNCICLGLYDLLLRFNNSRVQNLYKL